MLAADGDFRPFMEMSWRRTVLCRTSSPRTSVRRALAELL